MLGIDEKDDKRIEEEKRAQRNGDELNGRYLVLCCLFPLSLVQKRERQRKKGVVFNNLIYITCTTITQKSDNV